MKMKAKNGLNGPGNDINHQIILGYILYHIISHLNKFNKYKNLIAVPEFSLKPESSKIPDLTILKTTSKEIIPIVIFEICNKRMVKDDSNKIRIIMKNDLRIKEGFIINKDDLSIIRIFRKKDESISFPKKENKIETINFDLSKMIDSLPLINYFS